MSPCERAGRESAVIFGGVHGLPAEHLARVLEVAIAPICSGSCRRRFIVQGGGGVEAALEEPHDVTLTAPDGELARGQRPVWACTRPMRTQMTDSPWTSAYWRPRTLAPHC